MPPPPPSLLPFCYEVAFTCPVPTCSKRLSSYAIATKLPVLTQAMILPGEQQLTLQQQQVCYRPTRALRGVRY
eukprot:1615681-Rhodomonas_salina.1